jgi:hypothetical protein
MKMPSQNLNCCGQEQKLEVFSTLIVKLGYYFDVTGEEADPLQVDVLMHLDYFAAKMMSQWKYL